MRGTSIIGFDNSHYKSEKSRQERDWLLVGFSPLKASISRYVFARIEEYKRLSDGLEKYKMEKHLYTLRNYLTS